MYTVRVEGSSCEVEEIFMRLITTFDEDPSVYASKSFTYGKYILIYSSIQEDTSIWVHPILIDSKKRVAGSREGNYGEVALAF